MSRRAAPERAADGGRRRRIQRTGEEAMTLQLAGAVAAAAVLAVGFALPAGAYSGAAGRAEAA